MGIHRLHLAFVRVIAYLLPAAGLWPGEVTGSESEDSIVASSSATAGDCSAILQNVTAGGDITLNIKCDAASEQVIMQAMADGEWISDCPYVMPSKGWHLEADAINGDYTLLPRAGHYFSQFGFKFGMQISGMGFLDFIYLNELSWDEASTQIPYLERSLYDRIFLVMQKYPPGEAAFSTVGRNLIYGAAAVEDGASELEVSKGESSDGDGIDGMIVGKFTVQLHVDYEDGSGLSEEDVEVEQLGDTYMARLGLTEYADAYPNWQEGGMMMLRELSCTADTEIGLETFSTLCRMMIEAQSREADMGCFHSDVEEDNSGVEGDSSEDGAESDDAAENPFDRR
jgi:hypothetical protein